MLKNSQNVGLCKAAGNGRFALEPVKMGTQVVEKVLVPMQTWAFSKFSNFLVPDWAPGPVRMCRDRRDIAGRALKARFGRVFVEKSRLFVQIWASKRYLSVFGPFDP